MGNRMEAHLVRSRHAHQTRLRYRLAAAMATHAGAPVFAVAVGVTRLAHIRLNALMDVLGLYGRRPAEVSRHECRHRVQPNVMAEQRYQAEEGTQYGEQSHNG